MLYSQLVAMQLPVLLALMAVSKQNMGIPMSPAAARAGSSSLQA